MRRSISLPSILLIIVVMIISSACKTTDEVKPAEKPAVEETIPSKERTVWDEMRMVTDAYYSRSYDAVSRYLIPDVYRDPATDHAWRAITHISLDRGQLQEAYSIARESNSPTAWMALSFQDWESTQMLDLLYSDWLRYPDLRGGISLILGRQGNEESYTQLLSVVDSTRGQSYENEVAMALSRLQAEQGLTSGHQQWLRERVFADGTDEPLNLNYLYGAYRTDEELPERLVTDLIKGWRKWGFGRSPLINQYMLKITGGRLPSDYLDTYLTSDDLRSGVQLGIETARWMYEYGRPDALYDRVMIGLLQHANPHVQAEAVLAASQQKSPSESVAEQLQQMIHAKSSTDSMVWLTAVEAFMDHPNWLPDGWLDEAKARAVENPYFTDRWLRILINTRGALVYLDEVNEYVQSAEVKRMVPAFTHLGQLLASNREWSDDQLLRIRELALTAVEQADRGVLYALEPLLMDDRLVLFSDVQRILDAMQQLQLPDDIEAYQALTRVLYERPAFRKAAQATIDSLASVGYAPMNRSLRAMGWEIDSQAEPKTTVPDFRPVDWDRLQKLGEYPVLALNTEKGSIKVRLHSLGAPATVSGMDGLIRKKAYNGVPFHRVVRNFVIQGGDIERQDGFGGPDFVIPTEPDIRGFTRGAIGIASAGPDTEGSQYFIMHQWKPHLDGRYTRFGEVIDGMDVVDRIQVGDVVKSVRWQ
ncbi:MAG: peptidylprolyl isomerase [Bacteroidota bacterium]